MSKELVKPASCLEEFRVVKGFEGLYEVSNLGNVFSLRARTTLKPVTNAYGYVQVLLSKNGKRKNSSVHRLVADCFIPNPDCKKTVNHKDGTKTNNHVSNLEWSTYSENVKHAYMTGLKKPTNPNINGKFQGERNSSSKLSESDVLYIRENAKKNGGSMTNVHLAIKYKVDKTTIGLIVNECIWKHLIKGVSVS